MTRITHTNILSCVFRCTLVQIRLCSPPTLQVTLCKVANRAKTLCWLILLILLLLFQDSACWPLRLFLSTYCTELMCGRLQEVDLFACYTCSKLQLHSSRINFDDRLFCLLPLCSSFFTFHSLSLPSSLPLVSSVFPYSVRHISLSLSLSQLLHTLCLCLVPIFPLQPPPLHPLNPLCLSVR